MQSLLLLVVLIGFVLAVVLWFGTMFAQSYFYTEPAPGLYWRGPAAAAALAVFFAPWGLLNIRGGSVTPEGRVEIPYPVHWEFNHRLYLVSKPLPVLVVKKKKGEVETYKLDAAVRNVSYKKVDGTEILDPRRAEYVKFALDKKEYKFAPGPRAEGENLLFVDADNGWEMSEVEMGRPRRTSFGRLFVYFLLNVLHLVLWFAVFWLLLRFALGHASLFAVVFWFGFTFILLAALHTAAENAVKAAT